LAIVSPDQSLMGREIFTRDDDVQPRSRSAARDVPGELDADDAPRPLDLDPEEESPFLRGQKRVPVRRGPLPKRTANRLKIAFVVLAAAAVVVVTASALYGYGTRSWRFRLNGSDNIEISGIDTVSRRQVIDVMGGDIGRNVFFIPLALRKKQLAFVRMAHASPLLTRMAW
jgi:cell division protein FtsQ